MSWINRLQRRLPPPPPPKPAAPKVAPAPARPAAQRRPLPSGVSTFEPARAARPGMPNLGSSFQPEPARAVGGAAPVRASSPRPTDTGAITRALSRYDYAAETPAGTTAATSIAVMATHGGKPDLGADGKLNCVQGAAYAQTLFAQQEPPVDTELVVGRNDHAVLRMPEGSYYDPERAMSGQDPLVPESEAHYYDGVDGITLGERTRLEGEARTAFSQAQASGQDLTGSQQAATDAVTRASGKGALDEPSATTAANGAVRTSELPDGPAKALAAAQDQLEVSDASVLGEREQVNAEADQQAAETRQQADGIRAQAGQPDSGVQQLNDNPPTYVQQTTDANGQPVERYVQYGEGEPPDVTVRDSHQAEDGTWTWSERYASGEGDQQTTWVKTVTHLENPGSVHNPTPETTELNPNVSFVGYEEQDGTLKKTQTRSARAEDGTPIVERAEVSYREVPPGEAGLPHGTDGVFDPNAPVVEKSVTGSVSNPEGTFVTDQTSWSQGSVRVTESAGPEGPSYLVEKQEGNKKISQQYSAGSKDALVTETTLNDDGSVNETRRMYETNGQPPGPDSKLLGEQTSTRRYGEDGLLAHEDSSAVLYDRDTGQEIFRQQATLDRRVENGVALYDTSSTTTENGVTSTTAIHEEAKLTPEGEVPTYTKMTANGETMELWHEEAGKRFRWDDGQGNVVEGRTYKDEHGNAVVQVGDEQLVFGPTGEIAEGSVSGDNAAVLPLLVAGTGGLSSLLGQGAELTIQDEIATKYGGVMRDSSRALGVFSMMGNAHQAIDMARNGDYLGAVKAGVDTTGSLLDNIGKFSKLSKGLGVVSGGIDIATGLYSAITADDWRERRVGMATTMQGGLAIGAVAVGSGWGAAVMVVGSVGLEFYKAWEEGNELEEKKRDVPPLMPELLAA